jgi:zinc/manganese transport system substrate-binding protein
MARLFWLALVAGMVAFGGVARAEVTIFACEPEWGALAAEIGGDDVKIINATTALQDVHFISARPSLMAGVRKADLVFCTGAQLEIGWLPLLLNQSGNPDVQPGDKGYLAAADYVRKLEIPTSVDRALGDVHPEGNPHIVGNPHNIGIVARKLTERLQDLDPAHKDAYAARFTDFNGRWQAAITKWETEAAPLRGAPVVVQHNIWVYMVDWLGLNVITPLEPRPGIPPSTSFLESVLGQVQKNPPKMILNGAYENHKASEWLAKRSGVPEVTLPYTVGGSQDAKDLFSLYENEIQVMLGYMK